MCLIDFIVKYVLFGANLIFTVAGIAFIGIGIAVLVQLNEILELVPGAVTAIPIAIIVLGSIIFVIAFCGCCGAIKESRCLLGLYSLCMAILAAAKIYVAVVVFRALSNIQELVTDWIQKAFDDQNLRKVFHVMETLFQCCGTTGYQSYSNIFPNNSLPPSCCAVGPQEGVCVPENAFGGCSTKVGGYFESFGEAIGAVAIVVIIVELVAMVFGLYLCWTISNKRSRRY